MIKKLYSADCGDTCLQSQLRLRGECKGLQMSRMAELCNEFEASLGYLYETLPHIQLSNKKKLN